MHEKDGAATRRLGGRYSGSGFNVSLITLSLLLSDIVSVMCSFLLSFLIRKYIPLLPPLLHGLDIYLNSWPALFLWPLMVWREGLYPGFWMTAREELRRVVTGTTLASLLAISLTFVTRTGIQFSRPVLLGGWLISIFLVPAFRFLLRNLITRMGLSGPRAVILGAGKTASLIIEGVKQQRPPALNPVAIFDDDLSKQGIQLHEIDVIGGIDQASGWAKQKGIRTAVIAMPGVPRERLLDIVEKESNVFPRILVIPDLFGLSAADVDAKEVKGILTLELRKNLLYRRNRIAKRVIDLIILGLSLVLLVPLTFLIGLAILIESGGPVFYTHERIGKGGIPFNAWKYRTMVKDADQFLKSALKTDPDLREEWEAGQKLRSDPRLTKVGKFLRRLSLDELPQLWNVLIGEMSLVGPRPIVEEEIERYGDNFNLFVQVLPGLTGLWQVSGRSDLPYDDRVWLDTHYVRNWSIWLDLVILVRTVWVVIAGAGAY